MTSDVYTEFMSTEQAGNNVRRYRRLADITQAQLATEVEVSRQTVVSIEGGDYSPSVFLALRIAGVLDTTVEILFGSANDRSASTVSS